MLMKKIALLKKLVLPTMVSFLLVACGTTNEITGRKQFIMFGPDQDVSMGVQAMAEIKNTQDVIPDGPMVDRVERIGMAIAAKSDRPDFPWEFIVIQSDQLNAFALPGGQAAVYSKMVETFPKDSELAAIIGHEIAHAVLRHGAEQVSRGSAQQIFVGVIGAIAGSKDKSQEATEGAMELAAMATQVAFALPHSRSMELEADHVGAIYMAKAGFDPRAAVALWKKMSAMHDGSDSPPIWFSTHPSDEKRISQLEERMPEYLEIYYANKK